MKMTRKGGEKEQRKQIHEEEGYLSRNTGNFWRDREDSRSKGRRKIHQCDDDRRPWNIPYLDCDMCSLDEAGQHREKCQEEKGASLRLVMVSKTSGSFSGKSP
jgi:hypothetical protein